MPEVQVSEKLQQQVEKQERKFKKRYVIFPVIILVVLIGVWLLHGFRLRGKTQERMQAMCNQAHTFAMICEQWADRGHELESGVYRVEAKSDDDFIRYLDYYFGDAEGEWFALKLDASGQIEYTLYSRKEITEDALNTPPVYEEEYKHLDSLFGFNRKKTVAAWYADDSKNPPKE